MNWVNLSTIVAWMISWVLMIVETIIVSSTLFHVLRYLNVLVVFLAGVKWVQFGAVSNSLGTMIAMVEGMGSDLRKFFSFFILISVFFCGMFFIMASPRQYDTPCGCAVCPQCTDEMPVFDDIPADCYVFEDKLWQGPQCSRWSPTILETGNFLLRYMMGDYNLDDMLAVPMEARIGVVCLFWVWVFFSNVLMLNILIAMFGTTFSEIHDDAKAVAHFRKCLLVLRLEATGVNEDRENNYIKEIMRIEQEGDECDSSLGISEEAPEVKNEELLEMLEGIQASLAKGLETSQQGPSNSNITFEKEHHYKREDNKEQQDVVRIVSSGAVKDSKQMDLIMQCPKFIAWLQKLDREHFDIEKVTIRNVVMFGPKPGFILAEATQKEKGTNKVTPGVVFIRGASVCIFVVLHNSDTNKLYMVVTQQYRTAVGEFIIEVPAGMLDERTGDFKGVAATELKEELDVDINKKELFHLGEFWPSPGGCDELIDCFVLRRKASDEEIAAMHGKVTGKIEENEHIKLQVRELTVENVLQLKDAKAAFAMLNFLHKFKLIDNSFDASMLKAPEPVP